MALEHYKKNHLSYEDECGIYGFEFVDNPDRLDSERFEIICAGERE